MDFFKEVLPLIGATGGIWAAISSSLLNARMNRRLKEQEYRLAYLKELTSKRMNVYDEFLDQLAKLFSFHGKERANPLQSEELFCEYADAIYNLLSKARWLTLKSFSLFLEHKNALSALGDSFDWESGEDILTDPDCKRVRMSGFKLHGHLMSELHLLSDPENMLAFQSGSLMSLSGGPQTLHQAYEADDRLQRQNQDELDEDSGL